VRQVLAGREVAARRKILGFAIPLLHSAATKGFSPLVAYFGEELFL